MTPDGDTMTREVSTSPSATGEKLPVFVSPVSDRAMGALHRRRGEEVAPCARPDDFRLWLYDIFVIDSGASVNTIALSRASTALRDYLRKYKGGDISTANGVTKTDSGLVAQIADWDAPSMYLAMPNCPKHISMGERCISAGY